MSPDSEIISFPDEETQFQIVHIQFGFADEKKKRPYIKFDKLRRGPYGGPYNPRDHGGSCILGL